MRHPQTHEKEITFNEMVKRYCERQECEPADLIERLNKQIAEYEPHGFLLMRCIVLDSSRLGDRCIIPYGPNNTVKEVPSRCFSPRGLCSDISEVEGVYIREL